MSSALAPLRNASWEKTMDDGPGEMTGEVRTMAAGRQPPGDDVTTPRGLPADLYGESKTRKKTPGANFVHRKQEDDEPTKLTSWNKSSFVCATVDSDRSFISY